MEPAFSRVRPRAEQPENVSVALEVRPGRLRAEDPRWATRAAWGVIAAFGIAVAWLALVGHPVGDYGVESDFYGGYAQGARLVQQGHWDPRRTIVVGPVYEAALALASWVIPERFVAAKLISLASALAILILWVRVVTPRVGAPAGVWVLAFLAANPTFVRHAYAASTDMLAMGLQVAAIAALLSPPAKRRHALAGVLAGAATLTRYSSLYLVAGAWVLIARGTAAEVGTRRAAWTWFTAGFLAVVLPWCAYSIGSGVVPGERLLGGYGFYASEGPGRNVQDAPHQLDQPPVEPASWEEVVGKAPGSYAVGLLAAVPRHLVEDAGDLWGWPASAALLAGLAVLMWSRRRRGVTPIAVLGALCFMILLPAYHSPRYSLPLALFHATAACGLACMGSSIARSRVLGALTRVGCGAALGALIASAIAAQREVVAQCPIEAAAAGRALRPRAAPFDRIISRKGHVGYYAGLEVVPFPRVRSLRELGIHAAGAGARYLYYSWYETALRPEFAYLLDTASVVPGLTPVYVSRGKPAVLYRVGREFGQPPPWMADSFETSVRVARGMILARGDEAAPEHHAVLALDALLHRRWAESADHADIATRANPGDAVTWAVGGEAWRRLGRMNEAGRAFTHAIELDPSDPVAWIGLGRVEMAMGRRQGAARMWVAAAARTHDERVLEEIRRLLASAADSSAGARAALDAPRGS